MMISGIESAKDWAEFISYLVTSISLIGFLLAYAMSKKQVHFMTMDKCIRDFREIVLGNAATDKQFAKRYIDLVNEEFFYIQNGFIPLDVAIEWIDGMIDYLPFYTHNNQFVPSIGITDFKSEETTKKILDGHTRVLKAISLGKPIQFEIVNRKLNNKDKLAIRKERGRLIYSILKNLNLKIYRNWTAKQLIRKYFG